MSTPDCLTLTITITDILFCYVAKPVKQKRQILLIFAIHLTSSHKFCDGHCSIVIPMAQNVSIDALKWVIERESVALSERVWIFI